MLVLRCREIGSPRCRASHDTKAQPNPALLARTMIRRITRKAAMLWLTASNSGP